MLIKACSKNRRVRAYNEIIKHNKLCHPHCSAQAMRPNPFSAVRQHRRRRPMMADGSGGSGGGGDGFGGVRWWQPSRRQPLSANNYGGIVRIVLRTV